MSRRFAELLVDIKLRYIDIEGKSYVLQLYFHI